MEKYYKLLLNCAETYWSNVSDAWQGGCIKIFPTDRTDCIIGRRENNYFVDLILEKKIYYNPDGFKRGWIEKSDEILEKELEKGKELSCFKYGEISNVEALDFIRMVSKDKDKLEKYVEQISAIENKQYVREELNKRIKKQTEMLTADSKIEQIGSQIRKELLKKK
ncbi:MAG: hypothetical protein IKG58_03545 [Bacilli bacterium]|nr:hypothetical protein [Bacilli bacterium]MBR3049611.1 hypothetical protein [Bacilli bacterium]